MKRMKFMCGSQLLFTLLVLCSLINDVSSDRGKRIAVLTKEEIDRQEFSNFCELGFMIRENPNELEDTEECAVTEAGEFSKDEDLPMLFILIMICAWGAFVRAMARHFQIKIPYTVLLLISGAAFGGFSHISRWCPTISKYTAIARISPQHILYTFLPILIFESAFAISVHTFTRSFVQIFILAFPGMILSTFSTAYICWMFFTEYKWSFLYACLFGCIISATDPVAVVSILRDLGVSEQLGVLIDGESLMNDGVAILLFEIFHEYSIEVDLLTTLSAYDIGMHVLIKFCQIAMGGPLLGWLVGRIVIFFLSYVYNDAAVEISATLCASYLTYWLSEYILGVSGVMAVVMLGITMSAERTVISPESEGPVHHFWEMLGYLSNTVLFVIVGIVISETAVQHFSLTDFQYLALLYIGIHVIRFLVLLTFYPILTRLGYGLAWQNMIVMMWGGLRGAVGMCLALEIYQDEHLCQDLNVGPKILFHTAGIVLLTLVINGTTTKGLLKTLRLTDVTVGQKEEMNNAIRRIGKCRYNMIRSFQMGTWMVDARWDLVMKICHVENPYAPIEKEPSKKPDAATLHPPRPIKDNTTVCWNCQAIVENEPTVAEYREMTNDARLRAIKSMKIHYLHLFEKGTLTEQATQLLLNDAEYAEDKFLNVIQAQNFHKYMKAHGFYVWLRDKIIIHFKLHKDENLPTPPKAAWRYGFWWVATRDWFEVLSFTMITFNMITIIWDVILIYTSKYNQDACRWTPNELRTKHAFQYTNYAFGIFYTTEMLFRLIGLGPKVYFCNPWNYVDVVVLLVTYADIYLYHVALDPALCRNQVAIQSYVREYLNIVKGLRLFQFMRSLRLMRPLVPILLKKIRQQTNLQIFIGYDMGKGFVETSDAVIKFIPQIAENKKVQQVIKHAMKRERNACSKDLALIHSKFPGVAVALKTRHACRAVVNQMTFSLNEVKNGGLLDDPECQRLKHILEEKMKRLTHSPTYIQPTKPLGSDHGFHDQDDDAKKSLLPESTLQLPPNFNPPPLRPGKKGPEQV